MFPVFLGEIEAENLQLYKDISLGYEEQPPIDPVFEIRVPFLNTKEKFRLSIFYLAKPSPCEVVCRMEDLQVRIRRRSVLDELELETGAGLISRMGLNLTKAMIRSYLRP